MKINYPKTKAGVGHRVAPSCHFFEGKCSMEARVAVKAV